jgi:hypothetical protein
MAKSEKCSLRKEFTKGLLRENPVLRLVLGTCPTLATSTSMVNAIGMGIAATLVLICSNIAISEIGMNDEYISIGRQAFMSGAGSQVTELWLGKNVTIDEISAGNEAVFSYNGYPNLKNVYCYDNNYAGCGSLEELKWRLFGADNRNVTIHGETT